MSSPKNRLGLVSYWLTWCTIVPLWLVGKQRLGQIIRPYKPSLTVVSARAVSRGHDRRLQAAYGHGLPQTGTMLLAAVPIHGLRKRLLRRAALAGGLHGAVPQQELFQDHLAEHRFRPLALRLRFGFRQLEHSCFDHRSRPVRIPARLSGKEDGRDLVGRGSPHTRWHRDGYVGDRRSLAG